MKKEVDKVLYGKKELLGWVSIVGAFIWPWGTIPAFILSIILLTKKEHSRALAIGGLFFSSVIIILHAVMLWLVIK